MPPRPTGSRPADSRPADSRPANSRPADSRPTGSRPADSRPADSRPDLSRETDFQGLVIGIDEAGRGPWAGPVTVAAVWLDPARYADIAVELDDSKKLKPTMRATLYKALTTSTHIYSVISVPPAMIDAGNILQVTLQAMHDCAKDVARQLAQAGYRSPLHMLVDGSIMPPIPTPPTSNSAVTGEAMTGEAVIGEAMTGEAMTGEAMTGEAMTGEAVIGGDGLSLSIAAASIIAKHTRDGIMIALDAAYPGYGWATNMGYGTKAHQAALATLGVTPEHRKSYKPIKRILDGQAD